MAGTITYPLAVRVARSKYLFKLRNFYAIHLAIAPFLALAHINIFALVHAYMRIKIQEEDYRLYNPKLQQTGTEDYGVHYNRLKRKILDKDYSRPSTIKPDVGKELEALKGEDYKLWYEVKQYYDNRM